MPNTQQSSSEKTWTECQAWVSSGTHETDGRQRKSSKSEKLKDIQGKYLSGRSKTGRVSNRFKFCKVWHVVMKELAMCLDSVSGLRGTGEGGHLIICKWKPAADGVEQMQVCGKVPVAGLYILGFEKC